MLGNPRTINGITSFDTLYKVDNKGKIREWNITVVNSLDYCTILVEHGEQGGKKQIKTTEINCGKNIGKSNETSVFEQALSEASSKISKQLDKQYDFKIKYEKEFRPMLAESYSKFAHKVKFPAYVSRKCDGLRCYYQYKDGKVSAFSRNGKEYKVLDHISKSLKPFFANYSSIILDGELYVHGNDFEKIVGSIKRDDPNEFTSLIEFYVYDCYDEDNKDWLFKDRLAFIKTLDYENVKLVDSFEVKSEEEIFEYKEKFIKEGYEGLMIRNNSPYEQKRTRNLQKVKDFDDNEFKIIGIKTDKNDEKVFIAQCNSGEFDVKIRGTHEYRKSLDESNIGKWLKVQYFGWTMHEKPRFPVGLYIMNNQDDLH